MESFSPLQAAGGLGVFLVGMITMTDGLKRLAGRALKGILLRFTHSPISGVMTGAGSTAILQSSSATTVATVGFVGAGILSFPAALGIIFGANIGTTLTGWIVALVGFKLKIGELALPLVLVGALLRLFGRERWAHVGQAIAGFALIFVGIALMQEGTAGLEQRLIPEEWPTDTLMGLIRLVALGGLFTIITQSSSAGVAVTLTILAAGAIEFRQAAALVIGMDVGTTVTAALASIGGTVAARRTGLAHGIYNLFTAVGALIFLTPFVWILETLRPGLIADDPEFALVGFHSTFNALGVVAVLPFTRQFSRLMERIVSEEAEGYGAALDSALLDQPEAALSSVRKVVTELLTDLLKHLLFILGDAQRGQRANLAERDRDLHSAYAFCNRLSVQAADSAYLPQILPLLHATDHLDRLLERCEEEKDRSATIRDTEQFEDEKALLVAGVAAMLDAVAAGQWGEANRQGLETSSAIHVQEQIERQRIFEEVLKGKLDRNRGADELSAIRWLCRVGQHIARIAFHMHEAEMAVADEDLEPSALPPLAPRHAPTREHRAETHLPNSGESE